MYVLKYVLKWQERAWKTNSRSQTTILGRICRENGNEKQRKQQAILQDNKIS